MAKKLYRYRIEMPRYGQREGLILQINDGWGEIAPLPGWSQETLEEAEKEAINVLFDKTIPKSPSVKFGFFCANLPWDTSPLNVPLCSLNNPRPGCFHLKLKIKKLNPKEAVSFVKKYLGSYQLRLDCNRGWNLTEALEFASYFSPSDFEYLEEPVKSYRDLIEFSKLTHFPIAVDESLREGHCMDIPTLKAAIVKPTLMGEIPNINCPVVLSSSYESSLGILQIARFASTNMAQGLDTFTDDVLDPSLQVVEGALIWKGDKPSIRLSHLCLVVSVP